MAAKMYEVILKCCECRKEYEALAFSDGIVANLDRTRDLCRECAKLFIPSQSGDNSE